MSTPSRPELLSETLAGLRPRLRRFAFGLCGSLDEAEDLVQAAYERALARLHQWQRGSRLDSWMYRIVQSIYFNRLQADKVRRGHLARELPDAWIGRDSAAEAEGQITLERIRRIVQGLPADQRACLLLVVVEGLSYREAAQTLEVPVGTLTSRLGRARIAIKEHLDGVSDDTEVLEHGAR